MKIFVRLVILLVVFQNIQCSSSNSTENTITREMLNQKKSAIHNYISSFECNGSTTCQSMPFGSKPCGGPWEYIVFPSSVDLETLKQMVNEYNQLEHKFNVTTEAVSDCSTPIQPSQISCVDGECTIIN